MADEHEPPKKDEREESKEEKKDDKDEGPMEKALTSVLEPLVGAFEKMSARLDAMENRIAKSEFPLSHVNANAGAAPPQKPGDDLKVDTVPGADAAVKPGPNTEDVAGTFAQKGSAGVNMSKADLEALLETHSKNTLAKAIETVKASTPAPLSYGDQVRNLRKSWQTGIQEIIVKALENERQLVGFNRAEDLGSGGWKAASVETGLKSEAYISKMLGDE